MYPVLSQIVFNFIPETALKLLIAPFSDEENMKPSLILLAGILQWVTALAYRETQ